MKLGVSNILKKSFQNPTLGFFGLTVLMLLITVISFVGSLSFLNKPFPGFLIYREPLVATFGSKDWPGTKAGLKFRERIVAVDGQPVLEGRDVVNAARQKRPGTPLNYLVESKGETREVKVPVALFDMNDFLLVFFLTFLGGLILYTLGIIVYVLKPNTTASWVFLIACFCVGTYMVTGFEHQASHYTARFHYFSLAFFPAAFFHLFLIFPDKKSFLVRFPKTQYIVYLPALMLAVAFQIYVSLFKLVLSSDSLSWVPLYRELGSFTRIFTLFCLVGLIILLIHSVSRASNSQARQRGKVILFGVSIAFIPSVLIITLVFYLKVTFPWNFLTFFVLFFPASIAYSIVRHNLFDADEIIRRTVGYGVVTAVVVGAYVGISLTLNVVMGKYDVAQSRAFPILFTIGVILVFNPMRNRIQALVDRLFFRKEYDYGVIVEKVGGAMTSLLELGQVVKRLVQTFMDDMFISTSSVMLLTPDGTQFQVYLADGEKGKEVENKVIKRDRPLMEIIEGEKKELTKYDVIEDPKYREISEICTADFEALHASLMVPLVYQNQVIGSLNLGDKKSGKPYNRQDIDLLRTLASQGAVAIENARLFQENLEKQRMEEELNIARNLQMSMLPATCPEIKGFKIVAISTPAREVGGDFYDFFKMDDERLALIVGDVTGKSVSGALVMSASRSVFRMLSEDQQDLKVGDIMVRANRRSKKDMASGMFIALLYAFLNAQDKSVRLCSAGQTQPIHLSAKTGEASLVETIGDNFPLGILEDVDYKETRLQVEPGDRVVFYTDGIVEAMNEQEEIFGFERLLDVVKRAGSMGADSLLKEILDKVNEFAGSAAQHDDLTVIVVSVEE